MEFNGPKTVKIKHAGKAGYFGIKSFSKSVETLGAELNPKGRNILTKDEQAYFEKALELKEGTLASHSKWWDDVFNVEYPLRLVKSKTNELTLDNPINQLKYKVALASSKIANSEIEKNKPGISFYIDDVEAKAKKELETFNFELEGMKLIVQSTPQEKRGSLRLFGKKGLELMTEDNLTSQLYQELKRDPKNFFDVMTDKELKTKTFIKELEEYHLIKRKGNTYMFGEDTIGLSTDQCVEWVNDIKNQPIILKLTTKLEKIKKDKES